MRVSKFLKDKGQTTVEFLLLLVVAISIGVSFKKKMEEFMLTNPDSFVNKALQGLEASFGSGRYEKFAMPRD